MGSCGETFLSLLLTPRHLVCPCVDGVRPTAATTVYLLEPTSEVDVCPEEGPSIRVGPRTVTPTKEGREREMESPLSRTSVPTDSPTPCPLRPLLAVTLNFPQPITDQVGFKRVVSTNKTRQILRPKGRSKSHHYSGVTTTGVPPFYFSTPPSPNTRTIYPNNLLDDLKT